jgi:hypothetical protein
MFGPQIYNGMIVFTCYEKWLHYPNTPYHSPGYYHFTDVLVYNPYNGSSGVGRVENGVDLFRYIFVCEVGMDYSTGKIWWVEKQTEPTHLPSGIEEYRLYYSTVSLSPSITLDSVITNDDYLRFVQGKSNLYSIHYKLSFIENMATGLSVGSVPPDLIPLQLPHDDLGNWQVGIRNFSIQLDEPDKIIWFVGTETGTSNTMYGASIVGNDDKIITLAGGTFVNADGILTFNLVKNGVAFTSGNLEYGWSYVLGLVQK